MKKILGVTIRIGATKDEVIVNGGDKGRITFDRSIMTAKGKGDLRRTIVGAFKAA